MSTVRVAVDLDGVLANWNLEFHHRLATIAHKPKPDADWEPKTWDWYASEGFSPKNVVDAWNNIRCDGTFWTTLPTYPGAYLFLDWLWRTVSLGNWSQGGSHEVYFLTDRSGIRAKDQSEIWLGKRGFSGKHPTVLVTHGEKGRIAADLRLTHLIDDKPEHIESVRKHSPLTAACLLVRPWNQDRVYASEVRLMSDLKEFQRLLSSEF